MWPYAIRPLDFFLALHHVILLIKYDNMANTAMSLIRKKLAI